MTLNFLVKVVLENHTQVFSVVPEILHAHSMEMVTGSARGNPGKMICHGSDTEGIVLVGKAGWNWHLGPLALHSASPYSAPITWAVEVGQDTDWLCVLPNA